MVVLHLDGDALRGVILQAHRLEVVFADHAFPAGGNGDDDVFGSPFLNVSFENVAEVVVVAGIFEEFHTTRWASQPAWDLWGDDFINAEIEAVVNGLGRGFEDDGGAFGGEVPLAISVKRRNGQPCRTQDNPCDRIFLYSSIALRTASSAASGPMNPSTETVLFSIIL